MPKRLKTILIWLVAIFVVYWVIVDPARASDAVRGIWDFVANLFSGVADFFTGLAG
jgi:hypothetical protein